MPSAPISVRSTRLRREPTRPIASSPSTKTGIQALERIAPDLPMVSGRVERHEFEYRRHGTQALIAALDVTTGEVKGVIGNTRSEKDFARFFRNLLNSAAPDTRWDIVCDNLDIHSPNRWSAWSRAT